MTMTIRWPVFSRPIFIPRVLQTVRFEIENSLSDNSYGDLHILMGLGNWS
jgi:hypothetical protein